jgi:hypothetical protein
VDNTDGRDIRSLNHRSSQPYKAGEARSMRRPRDAYKLRTESTAAAFFSQPGAIAKHCAAAGYATIPIMRFSLARAGEGGSPFVPALRCLNYPHPLVLITWQTRNTSPGCRSSIENVAERTAVIVKIDTAAFPNVIVGDTEPFPAVSSQPNWAADFAAWMTAFRKATGTPLAFLHLDFDWGDLRLNTGSSHDGARS